MIRDHITLVPNGSDERNKMRKNKTNAEIRQTYYILIGMHSSRFDDFQETFELERPSAPMHYKNCHKMEWMANT